MSDSFLGKWERKINTQRAQKSAAYFVRHYLCYTHTTVCTCYLRDAVLKYSIYVEVIKKNKALEQPFKLCGTTVTCNKEYTHICYKGTRVLQYVAHV